MEIKDPARVAVGHWYSFCCEEDLTEITSESERDDIRRQMKDDLDERVQEGQWAGTGLRVWETEDEAMEALE